MKQAMLAIILLSLTAALGAQETVLTLENQESLWLYYAIDPVIGVRSVAPDTAEAFMVQKDARFRALAPGAATAMKNITPGTHTVVGFWAATDATEYGVFSLAVSVGAGEVKRYALKKSGALAALETKKYDFSRVMPSTPIIIDNQYADWEAYPAVAVFPPGNQPPQFTYQGKDGVRHLPLQASNFWGRGGTQLTSVKALASGDSLNFHFSAASVFSSGLSIFLYLFDDRKSQDVNLYTVEFPVTDRDAGDILLWKRGVKDPTVIGSFRNTSFFLEGAIDPASLPPALKQDLMRKYSYDLKTSFYERTRGVHEEFFFTSMLLSDIYARP